MSSLPQQLLQSVRGHCPAVEGSAAAIKRCACSVTVFRQVICAKVISTQVPPFNTLK